MKKILMGPAILLAGILFCVGEVNGQLNSQYSSKLIDIVMQDNLLVLKSRDEATVTSFLRTKNEKILQYLIKTYPKYGVPEVDKSDPAVSMFGLICAMYEANNFSPIKDIRWNSITMDRVPTWLSCALSVIGSTLGVTELVGTLGTFTYATVWSCVKFVVKKYVTGWLGTAVALYSIANECF